VLLVLLVLLVLPPWSWERWARERGGGLEGRGRGWWALLAGREV